MSRGIGEIGAIQGVVPDGLAIVVALLTQLGDIWFLLALLTGVYWFHDREGGPVVIAIVLGGLALTVALKHLVALPRPTAPLIGSDRFQHPSSRCTRRRATRGATASRAGTRSGPPSCTARSRS